MIKQHQPNFEQHNWDRYHEYHLASIHDNADFIFEMKCIPSAFEVFFFTAAPEAYRELRTKWFATHGYKVNAQTLFMRANYDQRSSVDLKRDMLRELERQRGRGCVRMAYDDRKDIIAMYLEYGIPATHRALYGDGHNDN